MRSSIRFYKMSAYGNYRCVARNSAGDDYSHFYLPAGRGKILTCLNLLSKGCGVTNICKKKLYNLQTILLQINHYHATNKRLNIFHSIE